MTPIRLAGLIFDLDGTLVNSLGDIATAVNLTRHEFGLVSLAQPEVTRLIGDGAAALVRATVPVPEAQYPDAYSRYLAHYERHMLDTTRLFPGVETLLARLSVRPLAVVTNKLSRYAEIILGELGVRERFGMVLGGDSLSTRKPNPQPIQAVLTGFGLPPDHVGMVGDGTHDIMAGRSAQVVTVAVTYGVGSRDLLEAEHPDYLIDTVSQLDHLLV